jgi:hypothetical protein
MQKRGGSRQGAGRKKAERPTDTSVAARVLAKAKAEETWLALIDLEKKRLGLIPGGRDVGSKIGSKIDSGDYQGKFSIIPLTNLLRYLEDRAYGKPVDTVNHIHDKPIEMNVTHELGERMRVAMEKAAKRAYRTTVVTGPQIPL